MFKISLPDKIVNIETGETFSLHILEKFRLLNSPSQIGFRYWDEKWESWSFVIKNIENGTDVTEFMERI